MRPSSSMGARTALVTGFAILAISVATGVLAQQAPPGSPAAPGEPTVASEAAKALRGVWHYEIVRIGERSVEISQVMLALAIVIVGLWLSNTATRAARVRLERYQRLNINALAALQKLAFYILALMIVLLALQIVGIPIGVFAFLGGAVAIGLGFGAQAIFNNFISGLILTFERPIRIGDLIEIGGHLGRVESIGGRCTRIKRTDGIDVLVPNSVLLENNLVNWTLTDKRVRTSVRVGVAYGSATQNVAKLIRQAVDENGRVLKKPPPTLVFDDFGDNALEFEIYFWTEVNSLMELRLIRGDVRFRIDALFREAGIVIAFPQRDTHLDTARPLDIRLVPVRESGATDDSPATP